MENFISAEELHEQFRYNFEVWFGTMQTLEPIVPIELELVEGADYVLNPDLKLSFKGVQKIKTFIHMRQLMDIQDWFASRRK